MMASLLGQYGLVMLGSVKLSELATSASRVNVRPIPTIQ